MHVYAQQQIQCIKVYFFLGSCNDQNPYSEQEKKTGAHIYIRLISRYTKDSAWDILELRCIFITTESSLFSFKFFFTSEPKNMRRGRGCFIDKGAGISNSEFNFAVCRVGRVAYVFGNQCLKTRRPKERERFPRNDKLFESLTEKAT